MKKESQNKVVIVLAIAIAILIVFTGVQAIELVNLKNQVNQQIEKIKQSGIVSSSPSTTLQKNLQNLPTMVGGC